MRTVLGCKHRPGAGSTSGVKKKFVLHIGKRGDKIGIEKDSSIGPVARCSIREDALFPIMGTMRVVTYFSGNGRCTRIGLVPDVGGTTRLTRTVGYAKAKELIMTARMIDADEAARIGLVNRVVAEGTQIAAAEELAREIARNAPLAVGLAKRIIDIGQSVDKSTFMDLESLAQSSLFQTEDFREGAAALVQRRDPKFKGR